MTPTTKTLDDARQIADLLARAVLVAAERFDRHAYVAAALAAADAYKALAERADAPLAVASAAGGAAKVCASAAGMARTEIPATMTEAVGFMADFAKRAGE